MTGATDLLRLTGLSTVYGKQEALRDISFSVAPGEIVAVLGHNGAGKTTMLKSIIGLKAHRGGEIAFDGQPIGHLSLSDRIGHGLRLLPEGRGIFPTMTVAENVYVIGESHGAEGAGAFGWDDIATLFPILAEKRDQPAGQMSGGQQQMLAVSLCLLGNPRCILLDEPSIGLAPSVVEGIFAVIRDRCRSSGVAAVIVEQNLNAVLEIADRVVVLNNGAISLDEPVARASEIDFWKYF